MKRTLTILFLFTASALAQLPPLPESAPTSRGPCKKLNLQITNVPTTKTNLFWRASK